MKYYYPKNPGKRMVRYETQEERDMAIRASHLKNKYGLSLKEYNAMLIGQGKVCRICKEAMPDGKRFHVDHNHKTGKVRGLLCQGCNTGIGCFHDDPALLLEAYKYLTETWG